MDNEAAETVAVDGAIAMGHTEPVTVGVGEHPPPGGGHLLHGLRAHDLVPFGGDLLLHPGALVDDRPGDGPPGQLARHPLRLPGGHRVDLAGHQPEGLVGEPVVGCAVGGLPMEKAVRTIWPFYGAAFVTLMLVTYVPALSMALPNWLQ